MGVLRSQFLVRGRPVCIRPTSLGGAASAGFASGRRDIGFGGVYRTAVSLTILVISYPGKRFTVIKHALAIQVVIAGNALKFGNGFGGRGMAHHTMQDTV